MTPMEPRSSWAVAPRQVVAHRMPRLWAAAARVSVRGSPSTVGRGPRLALRSSLPTRGLSSALAPRRASVAGRRLGQLAQDLAANALGDGVSVLQQVERGQWLRTSTGCYIRGPEGIIVELAPQLG